MPSLSSSPTALGVALTVTALVLMFLYREMKARKKEVDPSPCTAETDSASVSKQVADKEASETPTKTSVPPDVSKNVTKAQPEDLQQQTKTEDVSRLKELKLSLEREMKENQGLSEQNNFFRNALEERKATVQMFTTELQVC